MTSNAQSHPPVVTNYPGIIAKVDKYTEELGKGHPDVMKGLKVLYEAAFKPGALDTKAKELISLGISVAVRCDDCIAYHTRGALKAGASKEEIIEALGVALVMGAGIQLTYSTHTFEAMEQLEAAKQQGRFRETNITTSVLSNPLLQRPIGASRQNEESIYQMRTACN